MPHFNDENPDKDVEDKKAKQAKSWTPYPKPGKKKPMGKKGK